MEKIFYMVTVFEFYIYNNHSLKNFVCVVWKFQNFLIIYSIGQSG